MTNHARSRAGRPAARWLVLLLVLSLLLAACGGGDGGEEPDGEETTAAAGGDESEDSGDGGCELPEGEVTAENNCKFEGESITVSSTPGGLAEGYRAGLGALFEETTGATINWVEQGPDQVLTQLIASAGGPPPVDVVLDMYVPTIFEAQRADVFEPVDPDRIPNIRDVVDEAYAIDGLGPATWFWLIGQCYNTEKYEAAGLEPPDSIEDWLDPASGPVGFPNPENPRWNLTMLALAAHFGASVDEPQIVIDELLKVPNLVFYAATSEGDQLVQSGDAWTVVHSDGRCYGVKAAGGPVDLGSLGLEVDGQSYDLVAALTGPQIAKGTQKRELAEALINTLFTPEALLPLTTKLIYNPTKPSVREAMEADPSVSDYLLEDFSRIYRGDYAEFMANRQVWVDAWNRAFQG